MKCFFWFLFVSWIFLFNDWVILLDVIKDDLNVLVFVWGLAIKNIGLFGYC